MLDNSNGRRWARGTLTGALTASVIGNVAHTVLAVTDISLWLRVPAAVIWPVATFLAIEVLVRMIWQSRASHRLARTMLVLPAVPAAITSYQHLYSLLLMMGEDEFIAFIGPAAIDGLMIGCTMALLFTRTLPSTDLEDQADQIMRDIDALDELDPELVAPISPASRRSRNLWDARKIAEMAVDGAKSQAIMDATGASRSTVDKFRRVAKRLVSNPRAAINADAENMRPEYVSIIRELVSR